MNKRNQPGGYSSPLGGKLDALAVELRALVAGKPSQTSDGALAGAFSQARQAARDLRQATSVARQAMLAMARPVTFTGAASRAPSACPGGVCPAGGSGAGTESPATGSSSGSAGGLSGLGSALSSGLGTAMKAALSGDFQRALQSLLSSLTRSIAGGIGKAVGGGLGGSLAGALVGTGLSLLIGKLFHKRQSVQVENTVRSEVLNFPSLLGLDFAANPASRLFGERAVARGPAFTVEVNYKGGAEDIVTAKVASRLMDLNLQHGIAR
jgi:hypothetical protein